MSNPENTDFYKKYPQTCDPDDFWGQVKRTVNGEPVSAEQIELIVSAVIKNLKLGKNDYILDLCCGNGALSTLFFSECRGGLGVDNSEYLIKIALDNFNKPELHNFILEDVFNFVNEYNDVNAFNKAVCYGSLQYFSKKHVAEIFSTMRCRFTGLTRVFIGNVPDKEKASEFFGEKFDNQIIEKPDAPTGVWWSKDEFRDILHKCGWETHFHFMPKEYYSSHYRFDAILVPDS